MRSHIYVALVTIPVLLFTGKAGGQPTLTSAPGKGQEVVYVFQGGVSDDSAPNDAATVVYCTNLSSQDPVGVRVEFFGPAGFQIDSLSSNDIEPGHTKIFASQPLALIVNELNMATPQMVPLNGRVVVAGKKASVLCSAQLWIHPTTTNPTVVPLAGLPLGKPKVKFK